MCSNGFGWAVHGGVGFVGLRRWEAGVAVVRTRGAEGRAYMST